MTGPVFLIYGQKSLDFLHEVLVTLFLLSYFDVKLLQSVLHRNKL